MFIIVFFCHQCLNDFTIKNQFYYPTILKIQETKPLFYEGDPLRKYKKVTGIDPCHLRFYSAALKLYMGFILHIISAVGSIFSTISSIDL